MPILPIAFVMVSAMHLHDPLDRLFEWLVVVLRCQGEYVAPVSKEVVADLAIEVQTLRDGHSQAA
jgi:hypothetical protein